MIVSLPMYDRPETAACNDALWNAMRAALGDGPETLTRDGNLWDHWRSPDLLLSQTCGYPYRARLHGHVTLVASPVLDLPSCPPGYYHSVFVARADDPRTHPEAFATARLAYNDGLSQSGWAAPQNWAAARGFSFTTPVHTGAHRASAMAVAEGRADIAALDVLSWHLMQAHDPFTTGLRVLAHTDPTPALPYITALGRDADALRDALEAAIMALPAAARATLGLKGVTYIAAEDYLAPPNPAPPPPLTPPN
ncbi:ABC transporter, phosphonate, periplasmic substrate-binding protein [Roseovarius sp. EC-HK134]|uniref:phosphate/phosphite/phosphonate ABC transporter substrate-binding protein n=1 Tax=unclassified Roseovarius TaxID=2614913 RepID=UPI0012544B5D|nr:MULTISPECIES: PhnD/SsuA/transferrin family substrate-binding protein [unclassified Roseovarius]VVT29467.1 ABC transporter, phosphonate, periplasmic substrate-binding protein [Roseovarius sp. EC-HK134]VVT30693.1 ABC transporter, phosphonate, periplasmic substrate-binding protein [Roseovarius sp. EC-SD190]